MMQSHRACYQNSNTYEPQSCTTRLTRPHRSVHTADVKVCERMIDLEDGERVIIIGTVFKDMPLRPSVLDEYRDEATLQGKTRILNT